VGVKTLKRGGRGRLGVGIFREDGKKKKDGRDEARNAGKEDRAEKGSQKKQKEEDESG